MHKPLVAIVMGSKNDYDKVAPCTKILKQFNIPYDIQILSAHRTPHEAIAYFSQLESQGIQVVICAAGGAAHLAGVAAAHTLLPVIGIPLDSSPLMGLDALYSTVQMPPGVPVACMSIGSWGAVNAALFAAKILSLSRPNIREKIRGYREQMKQKVLSGKVE